MRKVSERKVSWFTESHLNVGKTFADVALSVLKELNSLAPISQKTDSRFVKTHGLQKNRPS